MVFYMAVLFNDHVICGPTNSTSPFSALADPTRRSILTRLAEGEATVKELA